MKIRRRPITAAKKPKVDGYAVKIHDMHDAMYDLLLFNNENDADWAYEQLSAIEGRAEAGAIDEFTYADFIGEIFNTSADYIEEIDFRHEIDSNDIWTALDDSKWQIVNAVSVDLWL